MEKILFMAINMNVGGMEKALLNMIDEIPRNKYEISILMLEEYGGFLDCIPKDVNVEYLKDYKEIKKELNNPPRQVSREYLKNGKTVRGINILTLHFITKILQDRSLYFKYILKHYPKRSEKYDIAIAYAGPNDFISYYILNKVNADKKIQWIHFDVTKIGFNRKFCEKTYSKFDKIFTVSEEAKNKLDKIIPTLKNKTSVLYNEISLNRIIKLADNGKGFEDNYDGIRILTVGRLSREKGQDLTIKALYLLKQAGYNVRWYCIGDGPFRLECEELISKYNLENDYILLGMKKNPYSYMKDCDIYVQPSRHEGYCITLAEAKCFCKPIISTNFVGSREQIIDGKTGLITNINHDEIYLGLRKLIDNKELMNSLSEGLKKENTMS